MGKPKLKFLIVDPQNDFCNPDGSLFVPGADDDSIRLAGTIRRLKDDIDAIHVTLDTHHWVDIAHPIFWVDKEGHHPKPFTLITKQDLTDGIWKTTDPDYMDRAVHYAEALDKNNRYVLCIWPPHCLIGSPGHNITAPIYESLIEWENGLRFVDYTLKGFNSFTEHYSAIKADVGDPCDPGTHVNMKLINSLHDAGLIAVSGQALSHCVANSIRDIAENLGKDDIKKIVLLTDTTSSIPGFEKLGNDFIEEMRDMGMQTCKAGDFM